jgi:hypothetical protein
MKQLEFVDSKMKLHDIAIKYENLYIGDKAGYHQYMDFYEKHLNPKNISRFLEIGIAYGASIRTWREWLPTTCIVEGWDINVSQPIENCDLRIVDQLNIESMLNNVTGIYDVILDDGGHTAQMMQTSFATLFSTTRLYIIEDLQAPWCGNHYMNVGDINTLDMLENFSKDGWTSQYCTEEQRNYINANAEIIDIFIRGNRNNPLSATCIIKNKLNNNYH